MIGMTSLNRRWDKKAYIEPPTTQQRITVRLHSLDIREVVVREKQERRKEGYWDLCRSREGALFDVAYFCGVCTGA